MSDTMQTFDPKLGLEAAETIVSIMNGESRDAIIAAFQDYRTFGEGNPAMDTVLKEFSEYESFFNDQLQPAANKIKDNFMGHSEFSQYFNNLSFNIAAQAEDVGTVQDANYDAARDL